MKKLIALASAALLVAACDDSSSSASGNSDLGTKFVSAKNVVVDEANQTIDMTLPFCVEQDGKAVLADSVSGPTPYTIADGKLTIGGELSGTGTNTSIIGVWNMDVSAIAGDDEDLQTYTNAGYKMYLDIGTNNFDLYINSDNVCLAEIFADEFTSDEESGMTIVSQSCNKLVVGEYGINMTIETNPNYPTMSVKMTFGSITCETKVTIEQVSAQNCTDANLDHIVEGMYYTNVEYSDGCASFGMTSKASLSKVISSAKTFMLKSVK